MSITPKDIKDSLDNAIKEAVAQHYDEHKKETAFSRKSPLDMATIFRTLYSMKGGSLNKELHTLGINVTASAFSQ